MKTLKNLIDFALKNAIPHERQKIFKLLDKLRHSGLDLSFDPASQVIANTWSIQDVIGQFYDDVRFYKSIKERTNLPDKIKRSDARAILKSLIFDCTDDDWNQISISIKYHYRQRKLGN